MKKILFLIALVLGLGFVASPVLAAKPANTVLVNNWIVFNRSDVFAKLWDDNKVTNLDNGGVGFTFNLVGSDWYTAYLKAHYNGDLTGTTITANISVTGSNPEFVGRGGGTPPTVGLVIKSAMNWGPNDYWFSTRTPLSSLVGINDELSASTLEAARASWINLDGRTAMDTTTPWTSYLGVQTESPYDGFTNALKNVKEVGFSFSGATYASGVALTSGTTTFQLNSFTVTP